MDPTKKLNTLIRDIRFAMMTTAHADGTLHSRPMACLQIEFDGVLWFFTAKSSGKVKAIGHEQHVNLAYSDPAHNRYVSVAGRAELVEDRHKAEELWNPLFRAWFPKGLQDPDVGLLRVTVDSAEYWDSSSSKLVQLAGFAKAMATGQPYAGEGDENARLRMN
jgi:general stress protein 26